MDSEWDRAKNKLEGFVREVLPEDWELTGITEGDPKDGFHGFVLWLNNHRTNKHARARFLWATVEDWAGQTKGKYQEPYEAKFLDQVGKAIGRKIGPMARKIGF